MEQLDTNLSTSSVNKIHNALDARDVVVRVYTSARRADTPTRLNCGSLCDN
jgi:hypothetical protein